MNGSSLGNVVNTLFRSITHDLAPLEVGVEEKTLQQHREKASRKLDPLLKASCTSLTLPIDEYQEVYSDLQVQVSRYTKNSRIEEMLSDIERQRVSIERGALRRSRSVSRSVENASALVSSVVTIYDHFVYGSLTAALLGLPQGLAAGCSIIDLHRKKNGNVLSFWKMASIGLSAIPPLEFLGLYFHYKEPFLLEGAVEYSFIPVMHLVAGVFVPMKIMGTAMYTSILLRRQKEGIKELRSLQRPLRNKMRRLGDIVEEIEEVQSIEGAEKPECAEAIAHFDQECITYLQGDSGMDRIRAKREEMKKISRPPSAITAASSATESGSNSSYRFERPEIVHEGTYDFAISVGVGEKMARRIARTVKEREANSIAGVLCGAVQEDHLALLKANPALFFMQGEEKRAYLDALHRLVGKVRINFGENPPELYAIAQNPTAYSTREGIEYLERTLQGEVSAIAKDTIEEQLSASLEREGYAPFTLCSAMLLKGFHLGTGRPNIGMAYVYFLKIRRRTEKASGVTSPEMDHFEDLFGKLIQERVILEDKVYKGGGGKFPGCYSINPHLKDIQNDALRQYVAFCLYQHPAHNSH